MHDLFISCFQTAAPENGLEGHPVIRFPSGLASKFWKYLTYKRGFLSNSQ